MELSHISALETKHAGLERRIAEEQARPSPNDALLKELKAPLRLRVVCRPDVHMQLFCRLLRQIERLHTHTPTCPTYTSCLL